MGYIVNFTDNQLVTAEYLNSVTSELGGGVGAFSDDMVYGVDDLNGISSALVTKGVSRGCELSVADGRVTIGAGSLFMSAGRRVEVDSEGVVLDYTEGSLNYVWFSYDAVTGFTAPCCTTEAPSGDDYVVLGQVTAEGEVSGRKDLAVMKNPFLGLHGSESFVKGLYWDGTTEEKLLWELTPSDVGYQHVIVSSPGVTGRSPAVNSFCGFADLSAGTAFSVLGSYVYGNAEAGRSYASENGEVLAALAVKTSVADRYYAVYLRFELGTDNVLRVYQRAVSTGGAGYQNTGSTQVTITLC